MNLIHNAFMAQLLLEEVDLGSTQEGLSSTSKLVFHMQHACSQFTGYGEGRAIAKPSPNNMPISVLDAQQLTIVLYTRAKSIERHERLDYLLKNMEILHLV